MIFLTSLARRLRQAARDCAQYGDGAPDSNALAKACTVWERDFLDAIRALQELEQQLYEAQNPMLPNGEAVTVSELYTLWQKAERELAKANERIAHAEKRANEAWAAVHMERECTERAERERDALLAQAVAICDEEADAMDGRLPDAFGGNFSKKVAANAIRGVAARIAALDAARKEKP